MTAKKTEDAVVREYNRLAPDYDRRWSFYIGATIRETLGRIELQPGDRVLDVGCGTGALLEALSNTTPGTKLAGVDPSEDMLALARERVDGTVVLKQSHAEELPFPDEVFDVVISTNALHYFRNPAGALEEMYRVLAPDGRIAITDWCDDYLTCKSLDFFLRMFNRAHFRTYGQQQCRNLLEQAGFTVMQLDRYKINWFWGLMTAVGRKRA